LVRKKGEKFLGRFRKMPYSQENVGEISVTSFRKRSARTRAIEGKQGQDKKK